MVLLSIGLVSAGAEEGGQKIITPEDLMGLPEPVQKFLKFSQVVNTPRVNKVELKQKGLFKTAPDRDWVPFTATQTFDVVKAGFEWKVKMKMAPLLVVTGRDQLKDSEGSMLIKILGLIPVVNARGPEMDQGAMTRYLSETIWFPQAWLSENIRWEPIDTLSARATLTINEKSVDGIFYFAPDGRCTEFKCQRYYSSGDEMALYPWRTPVDEYSEINGVVICSRARAIWEKPEGNFCYVDLEITKYRVETQSP